MTYVAGIDLGAGTTKCAILDEEQRVRGRGLTRTMADFERVAEEALSRALAEAALGRGDLAYIATTGLGRYSVPFRDLQVTDLTCGARGAHFLFPTAGYVLDMGAQSTRAIRLGDAGRVKAFHMNEKCAAGSGGFLERAARYLEVSVEQIGLLAMHSSQPQPISSVCAVLAETEIINHVSDGRRVEDILRGIHESLADRSLAQLRRVGASGEVVFIGGVALQESMVRAAQEKWKLPVLVPKEPQYTTALGAALLGLRRLHKLRAETSRRGGAEAKGGEALVERFVAAAESLRGIKKVFTLVHPDQAGIPEFFRALGFQRGQMVQMEKSVPGAEC
jgi:predicted CoA-substrate-specific enzyme activase